MLSSDCKRAIIMNHHTHRQCGYCQEGKCIYFQCVLNPDGQACDMFMAKRSDVWAKFLDKALIQKSLKGV